jgi:Cof subfamily protein (haloacid dehalogenase superfamily)
MELYISDLDGTLLNSEQRISEKSANIINQLIDKGINFSVATGRSWESTEPVVSSIHLNIPIILANGAFIFDPIKKENIMANYIPSHFFKDILNLTSEFELSPFILAVTQEGKRKVYYQKILNKSMEQFISSFTAIGDKRFTCIDCLDQCISSNIYTVSYCIEEDYIENISKKFKERLDLHIIHHKDVYVPGFYWLEIGSKDTNKKNALRFLKDYIGADKVICFGDNLNDYPMFEIADEKYAVSNASEIIKKAATKVIGSNDEDGVAKFLQSLIV